MDEQITRWYEKNFEEKKRHEKYEIFIKVLVYNILNIFGKEKYGYLQTEDP